MEKKVYPSKKFSGTPTIPGDKSISHRALILGALAEGTTEISNLLNGEDVQSTASCLKKLGVIITEKNNLIYVNGIGKKQFSKGTYDLDCGNSGTTMRVLMGVLAGRELRAKLSGDESLNKRPMKRVSSPLELMGAKLELTNNNFAPLTITGSKLKAIDYHLPIASAQIKTAIIMAALTADGMTNLTGEIGSRDHTERMLPHFGGKLDLNSERIAIMGNQHLLANVVEVPGDPSTAAFWIGAACMIPGSILELHNISLNPTRLGMIDILLQMGADIKMHITKSHPEPMGTILVRYQELKGVSIPREIVPSLIDEIPMIAVLATQAVGVTEIHGAEELRVKESDRLEAIATNIRSMGGKIDIFQDGFTLTGKQSLVGGVIQTFHDHRMAMAFSIAALVAKGETRIMGAECVAVSYPNFFETLSELTT